ncbi:MAG: hypothetical protein IH899_06320 [Planctomycetes bacterium]|nr:hypothetical protein [Planctomycetota bacterium]
MASLLFFMLLLLSTFLRRAIVQGPPGPLRLCAMSLGYSLMICCSVMVCSLVCGGSKTVCSLVCGLVCGGSKMVCGGSKMVCSLVCGGSKMVCSLVSS